MQYLIQVLAAAATISILNTTPAYAGDQYELTDLGSVFGDSTYPFSINEVGQVVGMSSGEGHFAVPFLWENGEIHELPTFGGMVSESGARDIRNDGVIAGWSSTTEFHQPPFDSFQIIRAFVLEGERMTLLDSLIPEGDAHGGPSTTMAGSAVGGTPHSMLSVSRPEPCCGSTEKLSTWALWVESTATPTTSMR